MTLHEKTALQPANAAPERAEDKSNFLDLLLPQDLPADLNLPVAEQVQLQAVLSGILHALNEETGAEKLRQLSDLLASISISDLSEAKAGDTGIPAKASQVEDFDRYFQVNRVTSSSPALPMLRGHLQACVAVLALCNRTDALPPEHVTRQIDGFREFTCVLGRVFGLADPV